MCHGYICSSFFPLFTRSASSLKKRYTWVKERNKYLIPNPSGFSKMIGSLSPLLWMNSYVKSIRKQANHILFIFFLIWAMSQKSKQPYSCWHCASLHPSAYLTCPWMCLHKIPSARIYLFPPCDWPDRNGTSDCWLSPPDQTSSCRQSLRPRYHHRGNVAGSQPALKWKWSYNVRYIQKCICIKIRASTWPYVRGRYHPGKNIFPVLMQTDSQQVHVIFLCTLTKHFQEVEPQLKFLPTEPLKLLQSSCRHLVASLTRIVLAQFVRTDSPRQI